MYVGVLAPASTPREYKSSKKRQGTDIPDLQHRSQIFFQELEFSIKCSHPTEKFDVSFSRCVKFASAGSRHTLVFPFSGTRADNSNQTRAELHSKCSRSWVTPHISPCSSSISLTECGPQTLTCRGQHPGQVALKILRSSDSPLRPRQPYNLWLPALTP